MQVFKSIIRVHELLVHVYHGCQKFNKPMRGVHQDRVNRDMPQGIITMDTMNMWHPGLQCQACSMWLPSHTKNIGLERYFKSRTANKKFSNLWFYES